MESPLVLPALGRIIVAIKAYRHQTGDSLNLDRHVSMDAYLKQQLSSQDWQLWQINKEVGETSTLAQRCTAAELPDLSKSASC